MIYERLKMCLLKEKENFAVCCLTCSFRDLYNLCLSMSLLERCTSNYGSVSLVFQKELENI